MITILKKNLLIIFLLICSIGFAQSNWEEVVYLKNGSIYRGIIIEQIPNQSIKIQTKDRNVLVFKYDEIEKITKESITEITPEKPKKTIKKDSISKSAYFNITELTLSTGIDGVRVPNDINNHFIKNVESPIGIRTINGIKLNNIISIGVGLGFEKYRYSSMIPISLNIYSNLSKRKTTPVFSVIAGYSFLIAGNGKNGLNNETILSGLNGGLFLNPQIGIKTPISERVNFLFNIGYKLQSLKVISNQSYYSYYYHNIWITEKIWYQFLTFSIGLEF